MLQGMILSTTVLVIKEQICQKIGKKYSIVSVPKAIHASGGSRWGVFGQQKSPAVNLNNVAPTITEIGVENGKHSGPSDYSRQILSNARSSPLGISIIRQRTQ